MARPRICDKAMRLCTTRTSLCSQNQQRITVLKVRRAGFKLQLCHTSCVTLGKSLKSLHQLVSLQLFTLLQRDADKTYLMEFLYKITFRQTKRTKILTYVLVPEVFQQGSKVRKMVQQSKIRDGNLFQ